MEDERIRLRSGPRGGGKERGMDRFGPSPAQAAGFHVNPGLGEIAVGFHSTWLLALPTGRFRTSEVVLGPWGNRLIVYSRGSRFLESEV